MRRPPRSPLFPYPERFRSAKLKARLAAEPQTVATRKASEIALEVLTEAVPELVLGSADLTDRKSTRLNSSHANISYAVFCLKKQQHTHIHKVYVFPPSKPI